MEKTELGQEEVEGDGEEKIRLGGVGRGQGEGFGHIEVLLPPESRIKPMIFEAHTSLAVSIFVSNPLAKCLFPLCLQLAHMESDILFIVMLSLVVEVCVKISDFSPGNQVVANMMPYEEISVISCVFFENSEKLHKNCTISLESEMLRS